MMPMKRGKPPAVLDKAIAYRNGYLKRLADFVGLSDKEKKAKRKPLFSWPVLHKKRINGAIVDLLKDLTKNHCSYCDGYPLKTTGRRTIDHFRPKEKFPEWAFRWSNLFLCCDVCQTAKGTDFSEKLLKPDEPGYAFHKYFLFDFRTGKIEINPAASTLEKERAKVTGKILGFNDKDGIQSDWRRQIAETMVVSKATPLEKLPYRFIFIAK